MDIAVRTLSGEDAGTVTLPDDTFGVEPRADILHRVVRWQLARRQQGTHKTNTRGEINATGKKMYKQKGTGRARHSDKKAPQFRGGSKAHGPKPRSHAHDLQKKVRVLGLKMALSAKAKGEDIIVLDRATVEAVKTRALRQQFEALGLTNALIIDGTVDEGFARAARNLPKIDVLPVAGLNVYDILRREKLVLTRAALAGIGARFNGGAVHEDDAADVAPAALPAETGTAASGPSGASEADSNIAPGSTGAAQGEQN